MSDAIMLPPPPVVQQPPARCWSAAYESWDGATAARLGYSPRLGMGQLQDLLDPDEVRVGRDGRASLAGIGTVGALGSMRLEGHLSAHFGRTAIRRLLADGYIYTAYYWRVAEGAPLHGHALVIYGIDAARIYVMDPDPRRGLITREFGFFAEHSVAVITGVSILSALARSLERARESVAPSSTSADIMSQFR